MVPEVSIARASLGEESKRWRVKRRRPAANPGQEARCREPARAKYLPPSPRSSTVTTLEAANNDGKFDVSTNDGIEAFDRGYREPLQRCGLGAAAEPGGKAYEDETTHQAGRLTAMGDEEMEGLRRRWRRRLLSNEMFVDNFGRSIPKLGLLPQQVSWSLTQECRCLSAVGRQHPRRRSRASAATCTADDSPSPDAKVSPPQPPVAPGTRKRGGECFNGGRANKIVGGNDNHTYSGGDGDFRSGSCRGEDNIGKSRVCDHAGADASPDRNLSNIPAGHDVSSRIYYSSWELREHFPPEALVPRAPPPHFFPGAKPCTRTAAEAGQRSPKRAAAGGDKAWNADTSREGPPLAKSAIRPKTAEGRISQAIRATTAAAAGMYATPRRVGVREIPHTISTGLRDLGLAWVGSRVKTPSDQKAAVDINERNTAATKCGHGGGSGGETSINPPRWTQPDWSAPRGQVDAGAVVGLTAELIRSPGVALDRCGRVTVVEKFMLAFDEVWPADLPALRPLRLYFRRSCGTYTAAAAEASGLGAGGRGKPVFLMPMHRHGKGVEGRGDELFADPPRLRRDDEEAARHRDRYCFRDESRHGSLFADKEKERYGSGGAPGRVGKRWARCRLGETGVGTWRWEWSSEAGMMLGKLALWKGALLVSRTQAVVAVFGLGMAGRAVVEAAPHPRGLVIEAYIPASSETCLLYVTVEDLKRLFRDDPHKIWVGQKADMVLELIKMLYFDYMLETEEASPSAPGHVTLRRHHYSDRERWECLDGRRNSDFDLHWERRRSPEGLDFANAATINDSDATGDARTAVPRQHGHSAVCAIGAAPSGNSSAGDPGNAGICCETAASPAVVDERAVWIQQWLRIRSTQNLVDVALEAKIGGGGGGGGGDPKFHSTTTKRQNFHVMSAQRGGRKPAFGVKKARRKQRVRAFDIRVEEYAEERRQAEHVKAAKLRAWLAVKKRLRGLTLGTVVRVSGRLLTLMVYEFPDQPGNLRVIFTEASSAGMFRVSLGLGAVAALARCLSIAQPPENWTLGQRRRVIGQVIREKSAIVPADDFESSASAAVSGEERGGPTPPLASARRPHHAVRCLSRQSTTAWIPEARTAARGSTRRRNAHQLQQPSPRDHRRRFPVVLSSPAVFDCASGGAAARPLPRKEDGEDGGRGIMVSGSPEAEYAAAAAAEPDYSVGPVLIGEPSPPQSPVANGRGVRPDTSAGAAQNIPQAAAGGGKDPSETGRPELDRWTEEVETRVCGVKGMLRRLRPRRECGRGSRLCAGIARVEGFTPGYFSLLRGNWAGAEQDFVLNWCHPWGFRPPGLGPVEAHTTFTLELTAQDLYLFTKDSGLMAAAENWGKHRGEVGGKVKVDSVMSAPSAVGGTSSAGAASTAAPAPQSPPDTFTFSRFRGDRTGGGAEAEGGSASLAAPSGGSSAEVHEGAGVQTASGFVTEQTAATAQSPPLAESEAWERVAREVLSKCFWKGVLPTAAGDSPVPSLPPPHFLAGSGAVHGSLEECVISQASRTAPSGEAAPNVEEYAYGEVDGRLARPVVRLSIGTCIFRKVVKVAGVGIPPMYLLVVVSQWHNVLVVRCYDFLSGLTRRVERPDPRRDAMLILEFKNMTRLESDMQLQVMLDELVVFEDAAAAQAHPKTGDAWSVKFAEEGTAPIIVDGDKGMYDAQVEEQMAAAAAQVEKRRDGTQKAQQTAREKEKKRRERRDKRDRKRKEARARRNKTGGNRLNGAARLVRNIRGGGGGGDSNEGSSDGSDGGGGDD